MTRREKKLLTATFAIVALGLLCWLFGSGSKDGNGSLEGARAAHAARGDSARHPPAQPCKPKNAAKSSSGADATPARDFLTFPPGSLNALLAAVQSNPAPAPEIDPFDNPRLRPRSREGTMAQARPGGPRLGGVFRSAAVSGALIDGKVYFEGDSLGPRTRLARVSDDGIEIERDGKAQFLEFDPVRLNAVPHPPAPARTGDAR